MLGAAPIGRRDLVLFAAILAAFAADPAPARSTALPGPWALEVKPNFVESVRGRVMARAKKRGLDTLVLNDRLSHAQNRRMRFLVRRFDLQRIHLRGRRCVRHLNTCALAAPRLAAVKRVSRRRHVDVVALRVRGPRDARRVALRWMRAGNATRLLLLPRLTPPVARRPWRRAIKTVSSAEAIELGVTPAGGGRQRAFKAFLKRLRPPGPAAVTAPEVDNVWFTGDFETGDHSQWTWGAQCANTGGSSTYAIRGTIAVQSEVVAQGRYAARFDLPAASRSNACETLSKRTPAVGTDDYYGLLVRFPPDWREPSPARWGLMIAQLNFQSIWGPPVGVAAHADHLALVLQSGLCTPGSSSNPGCANSSVPGGNIAPMAAIPAPLALGTWHALIVHVRWATDASGVVEAWHRPAGAETWRKTVSLRGYPTLQWTAERGPETLATSTTSDKIGAYRGAADFPLSVWLDGFVRATSFAAAEAALS